MKKLALMAAVAAIATTPALAASDYSSTKTYDKSANYVGSYSAPQPVETTAPGGSYTIVERDTHDNSVHYITKTTKVAPKLPNGEVDLSGTYNLEDGRRLVIDGSSAKLVEADGYSFYAPKGAYVNDKGQTFFAEDGRILRMENPPEVVSVDTDIHMD